MPLGMHRMPPARLYGKIVYEGDVLCATWLYTYANYSEITVYADSVTKTHVFISYGMMPDMYAGLLSNRTDLQIDRQAFVFLGKINNIDGIIQISGNTQLNTSDFSNTSQNFNKVYSNGNCKIYNVLNVSTG